MSQSEHHNTIGVFASCFSLSAMGGFFTLLRSARPVTWRNALAATFYSGVAGLVIALLLYNTIDGEKNLFLLIGVSGLAGLGGTTLLEFILSSLGQGGLSITIRPADRTQHLPDSASADDPANVMVDDVPEPTEPAAPEPVKPLRTPRDRPSSINRPWVDL